MSTQIHGRYHGQSGALFGLYFKTALLTLITLGIYRFWGKTRIRKYIWSATSGDGDSFEYTGTGLEKFLGFLVAVVILAIYLGIIQMVLFYFGIFLFNEPKTQTEVLLQLAGIYISFFALLPLIYFAQYRSRRYRMARTRWRGLRFGMDSAAWGYVLRSIWYLILSIVSLGILTPRQTFLSEKYMADRTWYGDAKFQQEGRWPALYRGLKHVLIGIVILVGGVGFGIVTESAGLATLATVVGYVWVMIGVINYRIFSFNYLFSHKTLDKTVLFDAEAKTKAVVVIYIVGALVIVGMLIVAGLIIAMAIGGLVGFGAAFGGFDPDSLETLGASTGIFSAVIAIVLYLGLFLAIGGVTLVLITQKIIEHVVQSITVHKADHLDTIRQRAADKGADAEGFADALDIGAAI